MVKTVDGREFNNIAGIRCSYGTTVRRVAIQGLVFATDGSNPDTTT